MSLFKKSDKATRKTPQDTLPEFVDSLLDLADLDSIEETDPLEALRKTHYGIDQAIELMNRLPKDKTELVVSVVKETLSSANVDVDAVIADAQHKVESMQQKIEQLGSEIAELKERIARKETETAETQAALNETLSVKKLLQQSSDSVKFPIAKISDKQALHPLVAHNEPKQNDKPLKSQIA